MANQHPVIDGTTHEDALTVAWVEAHYVPKETVRAEYVPKDDHLKRLKAKDDKLATVKTELDTAKTGLLEAQGTSKDAEATATELARLKGEIALRDDNESLRTAGIVNSRNEVDTGKADMLRFAHQKTIDAMDEDKRPEDLVAHFRTWLTDKEGAAAHPNVGHWVKGAATADPAKPTQVAPKVVIPDPNKAADPKAPGQQGKMTPDQLQAVFTSPTYLAMSPEDQAAKVKELKSTLMPG